MSGSKNQTKDEAAKAAEKKPGRKRRKKKAQLVSKVIERIEEKLESGEMKPTVGDFIRLLQLEKELAEEQPREIKVSWIEPVERDEDKGNASGE
jgi:vacuolar-type H+-ATPase subunit E/Vma4